MTVAHLHAHSHHSFGRGTASPTSLCAAAARQGVESLALTDLDGMSGVPEFVEAAAVHGLHPVIGVAFPDPTVPRSLGAGRAVLLARDNEGHAELCRLITRRHASPHTPLLRLLETCSDHLWVMTPDFSLLKAIHRVRGKERLLAELRAGAPWDRLAEEAGELGVPSVASAAVQLADASDRRFQRLLVAVHRQVPFARIKPLDLAGERSWMLDEGAMRAAFSRRPEALARAVDVARDCRVDLSGLTVPPGGSEAEQAAARLRHRVVEVAQERLGAPLAEPVRDRLEQELEVLCRGARAPALLLAAELATSARERGSPVRATAPALGSLVAWCLDLHPLNPLRTCLPFAPFCNDRADGVLRLDLQVAEAARPDLVERLRRTLGDDRVAVPGRILRWDLREAVRDVARSATLPATDCERILRLLPANWRGEGPDELLARHPRLQGAGIDVAPWDRVLRAASRLAGAPRGLGRGQGVLVGEGPVGDRVPLQPCDGHPVTQWDRAGGAALGLLALELPDEPAAAIELQARGPDAGPVSGDCPELEPLLPDLRAGRTVGCPGLEEPRVRLGLRRADITDLDSLLEAVAGVPGSAFAERRAAEVAELAGLEGDDADQLMRILSDPSERVARARLRRRFVDGMQGGGQARARVIATWDELVVELPVAPSRATTLSAVLGGLRCLVLRRSDPAALFATLLARPGGTWPLHVLASEAVRLGVELRRPCVQEGAVAIQGGDGVIRVGLEQVRGVRPELCLEVITQRRLDGPFEGLADLLARLPAADDEVDALIASGALDGLPGTATRTDLRLLHRHLRPHRNRPRSSRRRRSKPPPEPVAPPRNETERLAQRSALLRDELAALGFTPSGHPLLIEPELGAGVGQPANCEPGTAGSAGQPESHDGDVADRAGWLVAGHPGAGPLPPDLRWWTVFDAPDGLFDAVIPDRLVRTAGRPLIGPCRLGGQLRERDGLRWLEVDRVEVLGEGYAESA